MELYEKIRKLVNETGMKYYVLAKKCGYNSKTFSNLINGKRNISAEDVIILCRVLNTTPNDLLEYERRKQNE